MRNFAQNRCNVLGGGLVDRLRIIALICGIIGAILGALYFIADFGSLHVATAFFLITVAINLYRFRNIN